MRVLLDKNVPFGVARFLREHQVELAEDCGWALIGNGELIQAAEAAAFLQAEVPNLLVDHLLHSQVPGRSGRRSFRKLHTSDRTSGK